MRLNPQEQGLSDLGVGEEHLATTPIPGLWVFCTSVS
jgi:hypothetical protein